MINIDAIIEKSKKPHPKKTLSLNASMAFNVTATVEEIRIIRDFLRKHKLVRGRLTRFLILSAIEDCENNEGDKKYHDTSRI